MSSERLLPGFRRLPGTWEAAQPGPFPGAGRRTAQPQPGAPASGERSAACVSLGPRADGPEQTAPPPLRPSRGCSFQGLPRLSAGSGARCLTRSPPRDPCVAGRRGKRKHSRLRSRTDRRSCSVIRPHPPPEALMPSRLDVRVLSPPGPGTHSLLSPPGGGTDHGDRKGPRHHGGQSPARKFP